MANYKKITDVEVMEEVSENSMALVNENGVLKQVPCAGFGGGSGAVTVWYDGDSYYINITYSEFERMLSDHTLGSVVFIDYDDWYVSYFTGWEFDDDGMLLHFRGMDNVNMTFNFYSDNTINRRENIA